MSNFDFTPDPEQTKFLLDFNKLFPYQKNLIVEVVHNFVHLNSTFDNFNERLKMEEFLSE